MEVTVKDQAAKVSVNYHMSQLVLVIIRPYDLQELPLTELKVQTNGNLMLAHFINWVDYVHPGNLTFISILLGCSIPLA